MKTTTARYTLNTLPELTKEEVAQLHTLATRPDREIDTSDAPELTAEQWKYAVRGRFGHPRRSEVTPAAPHTSANGSGNTADATPPE